MSTSQGPMHVLGIFIVNYIKHLAHHHCCYHRYFHGAPHMIIFMANHIQSPSPFLITLLSFIIYGHFSRETTNDVAHSFWLLVHDDIYVPSLSFRQPSPAPLPPFSWVSPHSCIQAQALSGEAPDVSLWSLISPFLLNSLKKASLKESFQ